MGYVKKCELCGDEFEAKRENSRFCYKTHIRNCIVCNKEFEIMVPSKPAVTCSQSCVGQYSKNPSLYINKYENIKKAFIKKCELCKSTFETNNKNKKYCNRVHEKICQLCGDKFVISTKGQIYCTKQHYKECEVCGKKFEIKQNHRPGKVCSSKCAGILTNLIDKKRIELGTKKYKYKKQCLICDKTFETNRENQVYCQIPHLSECFNCGKSIQILRAYPDRKHYSCGDKECIKHLTIDTNVKKYGVSNVFESKDIKKEIENTNMEKYGVKYSSHIGITNYNDYLHLENFLINTELSVTEISDYFNVSVGSLRDSIKKLNLEYKFEGFYTLSIKEQNFLHYIKSLNQDIKYIINDRKVLNGKELDFYFPEHNLAVEISPAFTHNSKFGWNGDESRGKDKIYHWNKFKNCRNQGIELITIFDWHELDVVMKIIQNKLKCGKSFPLKKYKYYELLEISDEILDFINKNSVKMLIDTKQFTFNKLSILNMENKIVGVALWNEISGYSYLEHIIALNSEILIKEELIKKYIICNNKPKVICTSSNNLGNHLSELYKKLNFTLLEEQKYQLKYVKESSGGLIETYDIKNNLVCKKLEKEGFLPIYDCGYQIWQST